MKFKSPVYSQVSGSIAGLTYAHNQGGLYARQRSSPTNPNTARQMAVRANLASLVIYWGADLSDAERLGWNTYAANTPVTGKLGDPINLSGQNMFVRVNTVRLQCGESIRDVAPVDFNLGAPVTNIQSAVVNVGPPETLDLLVDIAGGAVGAGDLVWQVGAAQGDGVSFFKGPWRNVNCTAVANNDTTSAPSANTADLPFGVVAVGDRLPVRLRIAYDDGRLSVPFEEIVTVA